mgnify:FL=1
MPGIQQSIESRYRKIRRAHKDKFHVIMNLMAYRTGSAWRLSFFSLRRIMLRRMEEM